MEIGPTMSESQNDGWAFRIKGPLALVFGLFLLGAVVYAIYSRGVLDFLRFPFAISVGMLVLWVLVSIKTSMKFRLTWSGLWQFVLMWMFSAIVSLLLCGVGITLLDAGRLALGGMTHKGQFSFVVGSVTFVIGTLLFWMRTKWRVTYGISEAFVGVVIASHRAYDAPNLWTTSDIGFYVAVLTAGIYLVVRGLDNVSQGRELRDDPTIRLWIWFKKHSFSTDPTELEDMFGGKRALTIKSD